MTFVAKAALELTRDLYEKRSGRRYEQAIHDTVSCRSFASGDVLLCVDCRRVFADDEVGGGGCGCDKRVNNVIRHMEREPTCSGSLIIEERKVY